MYVENSENLSKRLETRTISSFTLRRLFLILLNLGWKMHLAWEHSIFSTLIYEDYETCQLLLYINFELIAKIFDYFSQSYRNSFLHFIIDYSYMLSNRYNKSTRGKCEFLLSL